MSRPRARAGARVDRTLRGVQAPGAQEDTSGGFQHGGWHLRYFDDLSQSRVVESIAGACGCVLGCRRYEIFAAYWPNAPYEEQIIAEPQLENFDRETV